jgi:hypothetical protein
VLTLEFPNRSIEIHKKYSELRALLFKRIEESDLRKAYPQEKRIGPEEMDGVQPPPYLVEYDVVARSVFEIEDQCEPLDSLFSKLDKAFKEVVAEMIRKENGLLFKGKAMKSGLGIRKHPDLTIAVDEMKPNRVVILAWEILIL